METRQIFEFVTSEGKTPVSDFINRLDSKMQKKICNQLDRIRRYDCPLQPPLVKAFKLDRYKGMYELRARIKQMVRIVFYLDSVGNIVLLHGFVKKQDRATRQALETARARQLALATGEACLTVRKNTGGKL